MFIQHCLLLLHLAERLTKEFIIYKRILNDFILKSGSNHTSKTTLDMLSDVNAVENARPVNTRARICGS